MHPQMLKRGSSYGYYAMEDGEMELMDEFSLSLFESRKITQFIRKASSPEVQLYPAVVEEWVARHQHDISRDERWRTKIAQQIADLGQDIRRVLAKQRQQDSELDSERTSRYAGVRGALVGGRNSEAVINSSFSSGSFGDSPRGGADHASMARLHAEFNARMQADMARLLGRMASQEKLLLQLTNSKGSSSSPAASRPGASRGSGLAA